MKFAIVAISEQPRPFGYNEAISPNACQKAINRIVIEAADAGMEEEEMQLMYILLSMIGLNNYSTPYMEQGPEASAPFAQQIVSLILRIEPCEERVCLMESVKNLDGYGTLFDFYHKINGA